MKDKTQQAAAQSASGEDFTDLVNADRLRSSIKRLFENRLDECLGELFQNSARARATRVQIKTTETGFSYSDNGHGLLNGASGFYKLLRIAESSYDNENIEAINPAGLGALSLLSHDQVTEVTFSSGKLSLTLDTKRFWDDTEYFKSWHTRLRGLPRKVKGLQIEVGCAAKMSAELSEVLDHTRQRPLSYESTPAQGYEDILKITLDGKRVETGIPKWAVVEPVVETEYMGERLIIGRASRSTINWYGQLITCPYASGLRFQLIVRGKNRSINPRTPTRKGVIEDDAWKNLVQFVKDTLFDFLFAPENRERIKADWVESFFEMDKERAEREAPLYLAAPYQQDDEKPDSTIEIGRTGDKRIFGYADKEQPLLLHEAIIVDTGAGAEKAYERQYGIGSFVSQLPAPYQLTNGNPERLRVGNLWWQPGAHKREFFYEAGTVGVSYSDDAPHEWQPIEASAVVYAFEESNCCDVEEVCFVVSAPDEYEFLRKQAWAGFEPSEDRDGDVEEECYRKSLDEMIRHMVGNCVPPDFTMKTIESFFKSRQDRVARVEIRYVGETYPQAKAVTAYSNSGEQVELTIMA